MAGFGGTGGAANCLAAALTFLERPLARTGLAVAIVTEPDWDGGGSVGVEVSLFSVKDSGHAACWAILTANDSSTSFASSADRRFLALRMAIARGCKSPSGRVSISWMSCALIAADSSAPSFSRTGGMPGFRFGVGSRRWVPA